MNIKKNLKDTAITAVISFVISSIVNLFASPGQDQEMQQVIKDNKNVEIINSQGEESGSSVILIIMTIVIVLLVLLKIFLCRKFRNVKKISPRIVSERTIEAQEMC